MRGKYAGYFAVKTVFLCEIGVAEARRARQQVFKIFMIFSAFLSKKSLIVKRGHGIILF